MNRNSLNDAIGAIATPIGTGGISIIRVSGENVVEKVSKFIKSKVSITKADTHTITYGKFINLDNEVIDEVLVSVMLAPRTYTGDDVVEINCHGGAVITNTVLKLLLTNNIRLAEAGEFTKRAFLNGRIDLSQAEGVMDLIQSKTALGGQLAINQVEGRLSNTIKNYRDKLMDILATIEMSIDYPEHDEDGDTDLTSINNSLDTLVNDLEKILENVDQGKIIRDGLSTAIIGKPNVGKSSLLNWLLDEERAIVTDIAGTTRDTVEEYINVKGVPLKIIDTAGIRETEDVVEALGVKKSLEVAKMCQCLLVVVDGSKELEDSDFKLLDLLNPKITEKNKLKGLVIINKTEGEIATTKDIVYNYVNEYVSKENIINISVTSNLGYDDLQNGIFNLFNISDNIGDTINLEHSLTGNARHEDAIYRSLQAIKRSIDAINNGFSSDFVSIDLQDASQALGEITGDYYDGDIIHRIFDKFCLGK